MATQDAVAQPTRTGLKELLTYTVSILVIMGAMQRAVSITVTPLREDLREDLRLLHAGMRSLRQNMNTGFAQAQQERAALRCGSPRVATKIAELFCVLSPRKNGI